jgi:integrase
VAAELLNKPGDRGPAGLFSEILVDQIAQLVGHSGTNVTELVYRHHIRPVVQTGATIMDRAIRTARARVRSHSAAHMSWLAICHCASG